MRIEIEIPDDKYQALAEFAGGCTVEERLTKLLNSFGNMALREKEKLRIILGVFGGWGDDKGE